MVKHMIRELEIRNFGDMNINFHFIASVNWYLMCCMHIPLEFLYYLQF